MHVLLIEDDTLIADAIRDGLNAQGVTVDHAFKGGSGMAMLQTAEYDVLVLDLGLPDEDGLDILRRLRRSHDLPVLILTARDAVEDRVTGLGAGADDYLPKPFDLRELAARLHTLVRRRGGRATSMIEHGLLRFDPIALTATLDGEPVTLARRELTLLQILLDNPRRILSTEQLLDAVYGLDEQVESNALNVHIHYLRRKLGPRIVETIRGLGYRLGPAGHQP